MRQMLALWLLSGLAFGASGHRWCTTPLLGHIQDGCYTRTAVSDQWILLQEGTDFHAHKFDIVAGSAEFIQELGWSGILEDGEEVANLLIVQSLDRAVLTTDRGNLFFLSLDDETGGSTVKISFPELAGARIVCHGNECLAWTGAGFLQIALERDQAYVNPMGPGLAAVREFDFNADVLLAAGDDRVWIYERSFQGLATVGAVTASNAHVYAGPGYHLVSSKQADGTTLTLLVTLQEGRIHAEPLEWDAREYERIELPNLYSVWPPYSLYLFGGVAEYFLRPDGRLEHTGSNYGFHTDAVGNGRFILAYTPEDDAYSYSGAILYQRCGAVPQAMQPEYHELCDGRVEISTPGPVDSLVCDGDGQPVENGFQFLKRSCDDAHAVQYIACRLQSDEWDATWDFDMFCHSTDAVHIGGDRFATRARPALLEGPAGYAEYRWSDGAMGREHEVSEEGTCALTVLTRDGCAYTDPQHLVLHSSRDNPRTKIPFPAVGLPFRISIANPWDFEVRYGVDIPGRPPEIGVLRPHGQITIEPSSEPCSDTTGFILVDAPAGVRVEVKPDSWWATLPIGYSHQIHASPHIPCYRTTVLAVNGSQYREAESSRNQGSLPGDNYWTLPQESRLFSYHSYWDSIRTGGGTGNGEWMGQLVYDDSIGLPYSSGGSGTDDREVTLCPFIVQGDFHGLQIHPEIYLDYPAHICLYAVEGGDPQCKDMAQGNHLDVLNEFGGKAGTLTMRPLDSGERARGWCSFIGPAGYKWTLPRGTDFSEYAAVYPGLSGHLVMTIDPDSGDQPARVIQYGASGELLSEVELRLPLEAPEFLFFDFPPGESGFIVIVEHRHPGDFYYSTSYALTEFRPDQGDFQVLESWGLKPVEVPHSRPVTAP
jgi:hypothetical protein